MPPRFTRMLDGHKVSIGGRDWRVMIGYGHAPEHASLYSDTLRVLISGDMVLPRISTNVSVFDYEPEANPLPLYLNRSEEHTSELQSLMRISYAVFCLKKKKIVTHSTTKYIT